MEQKTKTTFSTDMQNMTVTMTRLFDAPRELVYSVITDGSLMPQWWGPASLSTVVESYDVRPGGKWRMIQNDAEGNSYAFRGEFREVVPPEKIVYTFIYEGAPDDEILETITLQDVDGKTLMTAFDQYGSIEALKGMVEAGMEEGAVESWDRLAKLLADRQA